MKVKEYLGQAYRLDQRINSDIEELGKLREMSSSISSPTWEERELHADRTTVYRWHNSALNHVVMPENPIKI